MTNLIGQEEAEQQLLDNILSDRIHHAWLFTGSKGIGKATLAYKFATMLLSGDASQINENILSRIQNQAHGDFLILQSEEGVIKVDKARKIGKFLANTPAESKYRVVIIDSVDDMNTNASNAILKILEEPPKNTVLILISHTPTKLLPTIRSRCRNLPFKPLSYNDFYTVLLKDIPADKIKELYEISQGSIGIALELYNENVIEIYEKIDRLYGSKNIAEIYSFAGEMAKKWEVFKLMIRYFINKKAKEGKYLENLWDKTNELIAKSEIIYLDKKQVIADILLFS